MTTLACSFLWLGCNEKPAPVPPEVPVQQSSSETDQKVDDPQPEVPPSELTKQSTVTPAVQLPPEQPPAATTKKIPTQPLFAGWPEPKLVFLVTGQQQGYIEPCGCTGLANQKGGLARRQSLLNDLREKRGWNVVPVDVGSQSKRFGKQPEIKFQRTAEALRAMGYQAVTLGADDLRLTAGELTAATNPDDQPSIFVSANVAVLARDLQPTYKIIEAGGKKIGITGILGDSLEQKLAGDELVHEPAAAALEKVSAELKAQNCDLYVLLCHATLEESRKLAAAAPLFDLVVTAGGVGEPTLELEKIPGGKTMMAQVGTKGMYVGVVGVFDDAKQPLRYERVPLDSQWKDSPPMLQLLADYQQQLEQMGLSELGLRPQPHPSGLHFVGSDKCGECHTKAFEVWKNTPHSHATDSLVKPPNERGHIARHFDPECLSCHVTGWEPQKFFPFTSGYTSLTETPLMRHNGCENCHGPGSAHVEAESGTVQLAQAEVTSRRDAMKLSLAGGVAERKCMECHDLDNSPDFHVKGAFEKYWKDVEHKGKD
ncbi:multiheme c-type cytochrome [Anatilimnocola aggregata]|uniref:multiheme c-type cytochrome n=1 Tax=Anatilimnocola aggregata TaxID=2528021 RepID=UPI00192E53B2|nr:multiheme c-type cytochrome [Anatilimnocola aggregata]